MKKTLSILLALGISILSINNANAEGTIYYYGDGTSGTTPPTPAQSAVGGFAVVNPETGVVHGVIVGSIEYFGGNDRTMGHEYMGCPAGCLIVQQSTADQNGNVAGVRSQENKEVTYVQERNIFQVREFDITQTQTVTDSASESLAVETDVTVSRSARVYEFGVQNFTNSNGQFQYNEVAPSQNTSAQISTITKEFVCEESGFVCSQRMSSASTTLGEETISFSERKTTQQVLAQAVAEARTKIQEQINLILSMLGRWTLN